jgi:hypothetical protein
MRHECFALATLLNHSWLYWELFGDCPLHPPQPPLLQHLEGISKINQILHVQHSSPLLYFILHKAWDFLEPPDHHALAATYPVFKGYAILHHSASTVSICPLCDPRPPPHTFQGLQHDRAWHMAVVLIQFDFDYGDMVQWLEG